MRGGRCSILGDGMRPWLVSVVLLCALGTPSSARADRTQVYSIRDADCPKYPPGADLAVLTKDGSAVGGLEKHRVEGKYTVFDIYAEWCGPCRLVDDRLREIVAARSDVAVRKLNVVDFDTPLARELGPSFEALPYVVVFSPRGKRADIQGLDFEKLDKTLRVP